MVFLSLYDHPSLDKNPRVRRVAEFTAAALELYTLDRSVALESYVADKDGNTRYLEIYCNPPYNRHPVSLRERKCRAKHAGRERVDTSRASGYLAETTVPTASNIFRSHFNAPVVLFFTNERIKLLERYE